MPARAALSAPTAFSRPLPDTSIGTYKVEAGATSSWGLPRSRATQPPRALSWQPARTSPGDVCIHVSISAADSNPLGVERGLLLSPELTLRRCSASVGPVNRWTNRCRRRVGDGPAGCPSPSALGRLRLSGHVLSPRLPPDDSILMSEPLSLWDC